MEMILILLYFIIFFLYSNKLRNLFSVFIPAQDGPSGNNLLHILVSWVSFFVQASMEVMICTSWNGFSEPFSAVCSDGCNQAFGGVWQTFMCFTQDLFVHFWNFLVANKAFLTASSTPIQST